jgi:fatty acid desaturase
MLYIQEQQAHIRRGIALNRLYFFVASPHTMSGLPTPSSTAVSKPGAWEVEWPTWLLWGVIWACWLALVSAGGELPGWVRAPLLVVLLAWYLSFQHELIHGHPTSNAAFNRLLGLPPLAIWYPFDIYKLDHLKHHEDTYLTVPGVDTESNYVTAEQAERMGAAALWLLRSQRTVLGRLLLGPAIVITSLAARAWRNLAAGNWRALQVWAVHIPLVALLLWLLGRYTTISPWQYCFGIAYPALGLVMLRSLYEHRPGALPAHRTVINESGPLWRLLFLNNNYHAVHHAHPELPWYRIPAAYAADPAGYHSRNGGFVVRGYGRLIRQYAWTPVDSPVLASSQQAPRRAPQPPAAAAGS